MQYLYFFHKLFYCRGTSKSTKTEKEETPKQAQQSSRASAATKKAAGMCT